MENLALRLFYMDNAKEDVRSDIAVMRRAAEKADTEVTKAETDKQKQVRFPCSSCGVFAHFSSSRKKFSKYI